MLRLMGYSLHTWIALVLTLSTGISAAAIPSSPSERVRVDAEVLNHLSATGTARVVVVLRASASENGGQPAPLAIAGTQTAVLDRIDASELTLHHRFRTLPGFAASLTPAGLRALQVQPEIARIYVDEPGQGQLAESLAITQADRVQTEIGLRGAGVTVAVLDSGVDTDHPDLADAVVAQYCFTANDCPPMNTAQSTSAEDEHGHGTHVTSIVMSRGIQSSVGYAPQAKVVAVRVLNSANGGFLSDWTAGLEWVYTNRHTSNVRLINMSLGSNVTYTGTCDTGQPLMAAAVNQLVAANITVFAASGNGGSSNALSAPACLSGVISVGATYDSDLGREPDSGTYGPGCFDATTGSTTIACFTNSNQDLDLLAPGAPITASALGGGTTTFRGTSMAAPAAVGVAALMLDDNPRLSPAQIASILKTTGTPITDARSGLTFPLINAYNAVGAVPDSHNLFIPTISR